MKKILYIIYISAFIAVCFIPAILTPFIKTDTSTENRKLSEFPKLLNEDGKINTEWTKEFDTYFSEHFAFRNNLVNLNAEITSNVFNTSTENDVIIGKDGWLYYGYTADDFTGVSAMAQWEIEDIAHIIQLMQEYSDGYGTKLIFAAAPNKNSIYPEFMPYNYIKSDYQSNLDRLEYELAENCINYCSLQSVLKQQKQENPDKLLYHKKDTHWNNYGAFTAYSAICEYLGIDVIEADETGTTKTHEGDLDKMLYPDSDYFDEQIAYSLPEKYSYIGRFRALDDLIINTACGDKTNGLLMFRDSFGEAILPFMAESFGTAQFSRTVPYTLNNIESGAYNYAVLEIVERNLGNLRKTAPVIPAPVRDSIENVNLSKKEFADCHIEKNGMYLKIYGEIDAEIMNNESRTIYAVIDGITYEAFPVFEQELLGKNDGRGYSLSITAENIENIEIIIETENGFISTGNIKNN